MDTNNYFNIFVTGQIKLAKFAFGFSGSEMFCRYEVIIGPDWEFNSGISTGITQCTKSKYGDREIIFNMPIEFSLKSTNISGWPQIVFCFYGRNFWGVETSLGYSRIHVPVVGSNQKNIISSIYSFKSDSMLSELCAWLLARSREVKNPKILTKGENFKDFHIDFCGELVVELQTVSRGINRMGYTCSSNKPQMLF